MRNDFQQALDQDWEDFAAEVRQLLKDNPRITVEDIIEKTGGDYEDVLWAMQTSR